MPPRKAGRPSSILGASSADAESPVRAGVRRLPAPEPPRSAGARRPPARRGEPGHNTARATRGLRQARCAVILRIRVPVNPTATLSRSRRTNFRTLQGEREALLQLLDRRGRAVLLVEAEQRKANHDHEDDRRVDPLGETERDRGGKDQDQDERAFDLPPEQAQRAETLSVLHGVWADDSESFGGARRREAV